MKYSSHEKVNRGSVEVRCLSTLSPICAVFLNIDRKKRTGKRKKRVRKNVLRILLLLFERSFESKKFLWNFTDVYNYCAYCGHASEIWRRGLETFAKETNLM